MSLASKIETVIKNPNSIVDYFVMKYLNINKLLSQKYYFILYNLIKCTIFHQDNDISCIRPNLTDQSEIEVLNFKMYINKQDIGLSRTLAIFGVREELSTEIFRSEIESLTSETNKITVLDIGANIGYFVLVESEFLENQDTIHAIEPIKSNRQLLEKNVSLNEISDVVNIHSFAIGCKDSKGDIQSSERTNRHVVRPSVKGATNEVSIISPKTFVQIENIKNEDINVIRMDLEGLEIPILSEMEAVLRSADHCIVFVELHPSNYNLDEFREVIEIMETSGFEIINVSKDIYGDGAGWHEKPLEIETFAELILEVASSDKALQLITRKN